MTGQISRRNFIKLGTIAGIAVMVGKLPFAIALEVDSNMPANGWIGQNGKARYRWGESRKESERGKIERRGKRGERDRREK